MDQKHVIGIFGGSFNPPHISHVLACQFALCTWPLTRILIIPNLQHPLQKELVSYDHRFKMTELAFQHLLPWVEVSRIEQELGGISYTIDTIRELKRRLPEAQLHVIVGSDILHEKKKWRCFDELQVLSPFLVVPRLGEMSDSSGFFLPAVSSTDIRGLLRENADPGHALPRAVYEYVKREHLYL